MNNECFLCVAHYPVRGDLIGCNTPVVSFLRGAPWSTKANYQYPTSFDPAYKPHACPKLVLIGAGENAHKEATT